MSSYFYGLVQQRGPWATTDVDVLRNTQPRVTQSVVERNNQSMSINDGVSGILAGTAGYGAGAGYGAINSNNTINGIEKVEDETLTNPEKNKWGLEGLIDQEVAEAAGSAADANWGKNRLPEDLKQVARDQATSIQDFLKDPKSLKLPDIKLDPKRSEPKRRPEAKAGNIFTDSKGWGSRGAAYGYGTGAEDVGAYSGGKAGGGGTGGGSSGGSSGGGSNMPKSRKGGGGFTDTSSKSTPKPSSTPKTTGSKTSKYKAVPDKAEELTYTRKNQRSYTTY